MQYKYIIMCGGKYDQWETPRHLLKINGECIVERTIRLLREAGVDNITISTNQPGFENFGVPTLWHQNSYHTRGYNDSDGNWYDAFYLTGVTPVCYIFGDVVFSPEAIKTIVETETDDIEFFASAPPFDAKYFKPYAEPFAFKVKDVQKFRDALFRLRRYDRYNLFYRKPIAWELWQVIKETPLNIIDYTNYTVINDYTCDIDSPQDLEGFKWLNT